jgi:hypothetical protein
MGLSCCGRTGGPHGRVSTEVGLRRVSTVEFKRGVVQQLLKGEQTLRRSRASWTFVILRYPRLWSSGIYLLVVGFALHFAGYILERMH